MEYFKYIKNRFVHERIVNLINLQKQMYTLRKLKTTGGSGVVGIGENDQFINDVKNLCGFRCGDHPSWEQMFNGLDGLYETIKHDLDRIHPKYDWSYWVGKFYEQEFGRNIKIPNPVSVTLTMKQTSGPEQTYTTLKTRKIDRVKGTWTYTTQGNQHTIHVHRIDEIDGQVNLRWFLNRLNKRVFGNGFTKYGKKLQVLPVQECTGYDRIHYHLTLERPENIHWIRFQNIIRKCWGKTPLGYDEIEFDKNVDRGWGNYITKFKMNGRYEDFIDYTNLLILEK